MECSFTIKDGELKLVNNVKYTNYQPHSESQGVKINIQDVQISGCVDDLIVDHKSYLNGVNGKSVTSEMPFQNTRFGVETSDGSIPGWTEY